VRLLSSEKIPRRISRRKYIYTIGGVAAAAAVGGIAYYFLTPKPPILIRHTIHSGALAEIYRQRMDLYESQHPGIEIEEVPSPSGAAGVAEYYRMQSQIASARSTELDVMNLDVIWGAAFNKNNWCVDLSPYDSRIHFNDLVPVMVDVWTWDSRIGAHPWMADIGGLWYRKDIVEDAEGIHPPENGWTWQDFIGICLDLKEKYPDMYPLSIDMNRGEQLTCDFQEFLAGNGGSWFDEDWNCLLADTPAIEAAQMMYDIVNKYKICHPEVLTGDLEVARTTFTQGKSIFHRNWCYVWGTSLGSPVEGKVWETLVPHFPGYKSLHCVGGWSWAINPGTKNLDKVLDYLIWFGSYENMKAIMLAGGHLQARVSLYKDPDIVKVIPIAPAYYELYMRGTSRPKHPEYMTLTDFLQTELHAALTNIKTVEAAMNDVAKKIADYLGTKVVKR
jgi:multiple sugar transport system substrate-binding protein